MCGACVCMGFVMCGGVYGFCNVWDVCMCGFCNVCGVYMYGFYNVWVSV